MNRTRRRERRLRLLRRALLARKLGGARLHPISAATLEQLKNARRPLLFSLMPRMLRDDGKTADALQNKFRYVENNTEVVPVVTVSLRRWKRALATSRRISRRRRGR